MGGVGPAVVPDAAGNAVGPAAENGVGDDAGRLPVDYHQFVVAVAGVADVAVVPPVAPLHRCYAVESGIDGTVIDASGGSVQRESADQQQREQSAVGIAVVGQSRTGSTLFQHRSPATESPRTRTPSGDDAQERHRSAQLKFNLFIFFVKLMRFNVFFKIIS